MQNYKRSALPSVQQELYIRATQNKSYGLFVFKSLSYSTGVFEVAGIMMPLSFPLLNMVLDQ